MSFSNLYYIFFAFTFFVHVQSALKNVAIGKQAWASSIDEDDHQPSNAFDGNMQTRWSSSYSDSHSLWVDLGGTYKVSKVGLFWETAYASQFQIQTSLDGSSWTTVFEDYSAWGDSKTISFNPINARFAKIYLYKRATQWGFSLWEFQVFAEGNNPPTPSGPIGQLKQKILNFLYSISGSKTIAGQQDKSPDIDPLMYNKQVYEITGKLPGLWSSDFLFYGLDKRWDMTYEAERQFKKGALVNIMWHACPPTQNEECEWEGGVKSHLSDDQWRDLIQDGGYLNGVWKQRMESVAKYLIYLQEKSVVVMFRPHHEMNQGVFWWGGRTGPQGTSRLYQITHDYMTNVKGLKNLIWTWDIQDIDYNFNPSLYNPGDSYWDIAALDVYESGFYNLKYYNAMISIARNKLFAIGECGKFPTPQQLNDLGAAVFFMSWSETLKEDNNDKAIQDVYYDPRVLKLDNMPGWN